MIGMIKLTQPMSWLPQYCSAPNIEEGMITTWGHVLKQNPSLTDLDGDKFAPFTDSLMNNPEFYFTFQPFLPKEIKLVGPPSKNQNCFGYCLDLEEMIKPVDFPDKLKEDWVFHMRTKASVKTEEIDFNQIKIGDRIVYYIINPESTTRLISTKCTHAGVYARHNQVISRWGDNGPLVSHPINAVIPVYMDPLFGSFEVWRRKAS